MFQDSSGGETLRFHIQLPRADYTLLVSRLRGERVKTVRGPRKQAQVSAFIDLLPNSETFSITRLGRHRLPHVVSIRAGSPTHTFLTHSISRELARIDDPTVPGRLKAIIAACPTPLPPTLRVCPSDFVFDTRGVSAHVEARVRVLATLAPTISLELDDTPPVTIVEDTSIRDDAATPLSRESLRTELAESLTATTTVTGNRVTIFGSVQLSAAHNPSAMTLVAHWGSYDEFSHPWQDEPLTFTPAPTLDASNARERCYFTTTLHAPIHGSYGVAFYALLGASRERIWIGRPQLDDHTFSISHDDPDTITTHYESRRELLQQATSHARSIVSDPTNAAAVAAWFDHSAPHLSLGATLAAETAHSPATCEVLERCLAALRDNGAAILADQLSTTYGVGEIVFVTPEGPHAAAGGLAHVIAGLPHEITTHGAPVTIIAPLYRYANGNKHRAAEEILSEGVTLGTERVIPKYVTTVIAELGPTHHVGSAHQSRPPTRVPCRVYSAEAGRLRLILLANSSAFDRLYQPVYADEQLRRAILFSRAALETIATEALDIRPAVLISNDWMTACVPSLLALDSRYRAVSWLRNTKAVHMIHNGGADYHGRLPVHFGNEDLWPLLGLAPEHYFGFRDPHREQLLNLTMAAVMHANGGVLTVSRPYAQALVSTNGGDGLERILQHRRDSVFGISNGINRNEIVEYLADRVGQSRDDVDTARGMLRAKSVIRAQVQRRWGLTIDAEAPLLSFVGRLAEQKGLDLLSGVVAHAPHSALEDLLVRHPTLQIIVAGPITVGDSSASALRDTARSLALRYPGRVATAFDYISHRDALEIMAASTLFLMPSRFEPGGITQLEALAVGTPVVGRSVGGISATVTNYDPTTGIGTGFLCHEHSATAFANTAHWALATCADTERYHHLVQQSLTARHNWSDRVPTFLAVLQRIILNGSQVAGAEFLDDCARRVRDAAV